MDKKIIDKAKRISHKKGKLITQMLFEYFQKEGIFKTNEDYEETPIVKKLTSIIKARLKTKMPFTQIILQTLLTKIAS